MTPSSGSSSARPAIRAGSGRPCVPTCWDVEGFGTLNYGQPGPFSSEQGKYRHRFQLPASWQGQTVYLVFEGVMTDAEAWLNGQSAGPKHQGAYYAFKYDITKLAKFGAENLLEVTVDKESAEPSINKAERRADYWDYGGIFRPVYLEAVPTQHVERVAIDARHDGAFTMDVYTEGATAANSIQAQVMDMSGNAVGAPLAQSLADGKAPFRPSLIRRNSGPPRPRISIKSKSASCRPMTHRALLPATFWIPYDRGREGDGLYVNGQRIVLKGAAGTPSGRSPGALPAREISIARHRD